MTIEERKAKLMSVILGSEDGSFLRILEEDVQLYSAKPSDNPYRLSPEELTELNELRAEPAEKDTISMEEFQSEIAQWRKGIL